jgi:UrcA family protein
MSKLTIRAAAGAFAITVLAAGAAQAAPVVVKFADLDLATPEGAQAFETRADSAARKFCGQVFSGGRLSEVATCKVAVRQEISEKLEAHNVALAQRANAKLAAR